MPFVIEGSALRPEYIAPLISGKMLGVVLYADDDFLRERMRSEAKYSQADRIRRSIIDKFIARSLRDNSEMHVVARNHNVRVVDTSDAHAMTDLLDEFVQRTLLLATQNS
jgi:2-phosphoglycerate kinase